MSLKKFRDENHPLDLQKSQNKLTTALILIPKCSGSGHPPESTNQLPRKILYVYLDYKLFSCEEAALELLKKVSVSKLI